MRGECKAGEDVFSLEIGEIRQDLGFGHTRCEVIEDVVGSVLRLILARRTKRLMPLPMDPAMTTVWLSAAEPRYCGGMGMTLNIPDSVLQGLRIPEGEIAQRLWTELAIALYAQGALSLGKAAELAEMNRMIFGELVGQRGIARHYGDAELAQDVSYARSE
jgi:predicted HTH domain antitoxin